MGDIEWYMDVMRKYKILASEEQDRLCQIVYANKQDREWKNARDKLIVHNVPLVIRLVKRYSDITPIELDYIQEGCIGLHTAIDKYNPNIGVKFTTYAYWCIVNRIQICSYKYKGLLIPRHVNYKLKRVGKLINFKNLEDALMDAKISKSLWDELHEKAVVLKIPHSLDRLAETEDTALLPHDIIPDNQGISPDKFTFIAEYKDDVDIIISMLKPKLQSVIKMYYGIDCEPLSKVEIGKKLGISTAGVRKMLFTAYDKIQRIIVRNRMLHLIPNFTID